MQEIQGIISQITDLASWIVIGYAIHCVFKWNPRKILIKLFGNTFIEAEK